MCSTYIVATDGFKKDKALYEKALELSKKIVFNDPNVLTADFESKFFQIKISNPSLRRVSRNGESAPSDPETV